MQLKGKVNCFSCTVAMPTPKRVLVVNDDGIDSPGLIVLVKFLVKHRPDILVSVAEILYFY